MSYPITGQFHECGGNFYFSFVQFRSNLRYSKTEYIQGNCTANSSVTKISNFQSKNQDYT